MSKATTLPLLLALLGGTSASATTLVSLDLEALAKGAEVVARGRVERVEARWTGDGARIVTEATVVPSAFYKGAAGARLAVVQPGGVVGEVGQSVHGAARFEPGEDVVVFLARRGRRFTVTGMVQGKFRVTVRTVSGQPVEQATASDDGDAYLDPRTGRLVRRAASSLPLAELERRVRAVAPGPPVDPPRNELLAPGGSAATPSGAGTVSAAEPVRDGAAPEAGAPPRPAR